MKLIKTLTFYLIESQLQEAQKSQSCVSSARSLVAGKHCILPLQ